MAPIRYYARSDSDQRIHGTCRNRKFDDHRWNAQLRRLGPFVAWTFPGICKWRTGGWKRPHNCEKMIMLTLSETSFNSLVCSCGILLVWRSRSQGSGFTQSIAGFGDRNSVLIPYVPTTADPQYVCSFARSVSKQSRLKHGILSLVLFGGAGGFRYEQFPFPIGFT